MPPSQCDSARQKNMPRPNAEKSRITVAPVVVRPDIDSNIASSALMPASMNGSEPEHATSIQLTATMASPSTRRRSSRSGAPKWIIT
jgi:hypothetical protein